MVFRARAFIAVQFWGWTPYWHHKGAKTDKIRPNFSKATMYAGQPI